MHTNLNLALSNYDGPKLIKHYRNCSRISRRVSIPRSIPQATLNFITISELIEPQINGKRYLFEFFYIPKTF